MDGQVEVADKTADDDDLLSVFLTEEGFIGTSNINQFGDDGGYAAEVNRPLSAAELMRNVAFSMKVI